MGRGPGAKGIGWRWYREADGMLWHRAHEGRTACGAGVRGVGQRDAPPPTDEVCEECARLTGFRRRRDRPKVTVRVRLDAREVRAVRRAGLDPVELLVAGWRAELARRRPLERVRKAADRDLELVVYDAALPLLEEWGGKGVPIRALRRVTRLPRRVLHDVLGLPRSIRFPGALGVHRAYPADRLRALGVRATETTKGGGA